MSATGRSHHRRDSQRQRDHEQRIMLEEQAARAALAGYNARENARARRMRTFLHACPLCGSPVYADPGHCTDCAWMNGGAA